MAAFTDNLDLDYRHSSSEAALADSNVSLIVKRIIVESVDFIDSLQAPLLQHRISTTRTFLSWLQKKSYALIARNLGSICAINAGCGHQAGHVAVMTAHVRVFSFFRVRQAWVGLKHRKSIKFRPQRN